ARSLWWRDWARLFLIRRATTDRPDIGRITVAGVHGRLFRGLELCRTAQALRGRRAVASDRLDVRATIAESVRRAGWLTPVPAQRRLAPEYLALVDRAGFRDHQARLFHELLDRLAEEDVVIARYDFDGDPRTCRTGLGASGSLTLHDLAERHPEHRLILC